ncbi:MAG: chitobiase/beta-hexosaminidase C-terminal domain-containing protein, partial [Bacteroidota bacterium]
PAASFRPFIYTYATSTYMGENAASSAGADWAWARYVMGQYRKANAFGVTKGDAWGAANGVDKYLIALVWGGRGIPDVALYESSYLPILDQLKTLWQTYGSDPYFFDRYYHSEAQLLTGFNIGRAGMPIFELDTMTSQEIQISLSSWTPGASIHYTTDGTVPTLSSPTYQTPILWDGQSKFQARAFRSDLEESRVASLGRSVVTNLSDPVISLAQAQLLSVFPNPAHSTATIRYSLPHSQSVQFELSDPSGKIIERFDGNASGRGHQTHQINVDHLPSGVYVLRMKHGNQYSLPQKLVVVRK